MNTTTTLAHGEVRPENARKYAGDGSGRKGCTMVTTDGHWAVSVRRTTVALHVNRYTVADDMGTYASGVDQAAAIAAMRDRWASLGATVYGADSCWRAFLR